jgi:hypothetical protein
MTKCFELYMVGPRKYPEIVDNSYPSHRYFDSEIMSLSGEFDKKLQNVKCPWIMGGFTGGGGGLNPS